MKNPRLHVDPLGPSSPDETAACVWVLRANLEFRNVQGCSVPLFQLPAQDLRGRHLLECVPPQSRGRWHKAAERALRGETVQFRQPCLAGDSARRVAYSVVLFAIPGGSRGPGLAGAAQPVRQPAARNADLARFLHDEVGQRLSAAGLELDLLRLDFAGVAPHAAQRIDRVQAALESLMQQIRELSRELESKSSCSPVRKDRDGVHCSAGR